MTQLQDKVMKVLKKGRKKPIEVAERLNISYQEALSCLRTLVTLEKIIRHKEGNKTYYRREGDCPLQDLFYSKEKVLGKLKVKESKKYYLDNSKIVSYSRDSLGDIARSYENTIYLGGE